LVALNLTFNRKKRRKRASAKIDRKVEMKLKNVSRQNKDFRAKSFLHKKKGSKLQISGLPDFSWFNIPKREKMITKLPIGHKIYKMAE
jgi:hypothetical protein